LRRGSYGLGFLDHDDGLPLDFGARSRFRFHDGVGWRFPWLERAANSTVAVVSHVELVVGLADFVS
jgi:hypothetical protein